MGSRWWSGRAPEGQNPTVSQYTFGDDRPALERLRLVAAAYEPVSSAFLAANSPATVDVALDLGCGPAFSTQLLAEVCAPGTLIGVDSSAEFLESARGRLPKAQFVRHDVTATPLPGSPARLLYSRLLLAHLPDPAAVVGRWLSQLQPDGVLLIEDLDEVLNPPGPLRRYEEVSTRIVHTGHGSMYGGAALAHLGGETHPVTVPGYLAARIYLFNVRRWLRSPAASVPEEGLEELEQGLMGLVRDDRGNTVTWVVRQLAICA